MRERTYIMSYDPGVGYSFVRMLDGLILARDLGTFPSSKNAQGAGNA